MRERERERMRRKEGDGVLEEIKSGIGKAYGK